SPNLARGDPRKWRHAAIRLNDGIRPDTRAKLDLACAANRATRSKFNWRALIDDVAFKSSSHAVCNDPAVIAQDDVRPDKRDVWIGNDPANPRVGANVNRRRVGAQ